MQRPLSRFVRAGKSREVKSKHAKPGENRNKSARGTLGNPSHRPPRSPFFHCSCFSPTEGASAEKRGEMALHQVSCQFLLLL